MQMSQTILFICIALIIGIQVAETRSKNRLSSLRQSYPFRSKL